MIDSFSRPAPIRFIHRGRLIELRDVPPTRTVLQWLREQAGAMGTKEGCAEGDCGACSVIVAELDDDTDGHLADSVLRRDGLRLRAVNACIRFLPTLDGKALLTVEDLSAADGTLHPAQQALIHCHGSQCGFCTPGFAVHLALAHEGARCSGKAPSREGLADALAGNLCRCTGYRPILDAGQRMGLLSGADLPLDGLRERLQELKNLAASPAKTGSDAVPPAWQAPQSLAELAEARQRWPQARLLAGGTDLALGVTKQLRDPGPLIWLGAVPELRRLGLGPDGWLEIGAAVTLEDGWSALAAQWPELTAMWKRFAGPPVRHAGTLVGNLANGSPIGDSAPVLLTLGGRLRLRLGDTVREVALEDFQTGYQRNLLAPGEFIEALRVPAAASAGQGSVESVDPAAGWHLRAWKLSKRHDCDISTLSAALALRIDPRSNRIEAVRLAFGGMAATVRRAPLAEGALLGASVTDEAALNTACAALNQDFQPIDDLRASAAYRRRAAAGLLRRFWLEICQGVPAAELRVFDDHHLVSGASA